MNYSFIIPDFIIWFVGALFASFGNCVGYRIPRKMNWWSERSCCSRCGHKLKPLDLVPVLSCLLLHGSCRYCGYHFGYFHAVTELVVGIICVIVYIISGRQYSSLFFVLLLCIFYIIVSTLVQFLSYKNHQHKL